MNIPIKLGEARAVVILANAMAFHLFASICFLLVALFVDSVVLVVLGKSVLGVLSIASAHFQTIANT